MRPKGVARAVLLLALFWSAVDKKLAKYGM
jgi:hypothetical protein